MFTFANLSQHIHTRNEQSHESIHICTSAHIKVDLLDKLQSCLAKIHLIGPNIFIYLQGTNDLYR